MNRVLITGANGFVGRRLCQVLVDNGSIVHAITRHKNSYLETPALKHFLVSDIGNDTVWGSALEGVNCVIHLAARVHVMSETSTNPLEKFRNINTEGTLNLAKKAAESGVNRFIYISSIKVNGEVTLPGSPFTPDDTYVPIDPYALSKYEAEQGLLTLAKETNMDVVIIRSPLVYGPGVKANFAAMMKWMGKPVPLPFGAIHNQRSLVALDNLVSFISLCVDLQKSPKAANQVFLISDDEDVSTTQLLRKVAKALNHQPPLGIKAWLVPVPVSIMTFFAKLLGKGAVANRLFGSLQVDSSKARDLLGWEPVITMNEQLAKMAKDT